MKGFALLFAILLVIASCQQNETKRRLLSLNGQWQIAKPNSFEEISDDFSSTVQVTGLVDVSILFRQNHL